MLVPASCSFPCFVQTSSSCNDLSEIEANQKYEFLSSKNDHNETR